MHLFYEILTDTKGNGYRQTDMFCPVSEVFYPVKYFEIEEQTGVECLILKWLQNKPYYKKEHIRINMSAKFEDTY